MYLGLDLGTTNVKAAVIEPRPREVREERGRGGEASGQGWVVTGEASVPVRLCPGPNGSVEQDLEEIWAAACSAIRQAAGNCDARIEAVGVSSQGGAMQITDAAGRPLGQVISWLDQRGAPWNERLTGEIGEDWFVARIGHRGAGLAIGQLLRLREEAPELLKEPHRIGFVGDIIVGRLSGRSAHDGTSCALTLLYNRRLRDYDPEVLEQLAIAKEQMPELLAPTQAAGLITSAAAEATGLRAGIPVSAAIHDQYAAALGAGVVRGGMTLLGTGTAWVLLAVTAEPTPPVTANAFVCHHVAAGLHGQILSMVNGGSAVKWALELVGRSGELVDDLLKTAPAGSEGVCFRPLLAPAKLSGVAPGTRGCLSGLQLAHGPAHIVRAAVEGLTFELNRHLLLLKRAGISIAQLVMTGAAAASEVTPQIIADTTGLTVLCRGQYAGSVLGAAILARGLQDRAKTLAALAEEMSPWGREFCPGPNASLYASRFAEYLRMLPLV